jgi:hypothetical protein
VAPLDGSYAKLLRAREHLDLLKTEIARNRDSVLRAVLTEAVFHPDLPQPQFHVRIVKAPDVPKRFGTIIGDTVHNLRSSLDYLAHEVTALHADGPYDQSQFPIVDEPADLNQWRNKKTLAYFTPDQRAIVEWHQPYNSPARNYGEGPLDIRLARFKANLPLRDLRELANTDKHRLLIQPFVTPQDQSVTVTPLRDCENLSPTFYGVMPLKEGTKIAGFAADITGPNPQVSVDLDFTPELQATNTLELATAKALQIVREFERFF